MDRFDEMAKQILHKLLAEHGCQTAIVPRVSDAIAALRAAATVPKDHVRDHNGDLHQLPFHLMHKGGQVVAMFAWGDIARQYAERGYQIGSWSPQDVSVVVPATREAAEAAKEAK